MTEIEEQFFLPQRYGYTGIDAFHQEEIDMLTLGIFSIS